MGTDIHGVFQRRNPATAQWEDIPHKYEAGRDYYLFAMLAGVRNGFGFAGCEIFEPLTPIAEPRGYPDDFQVDGDTHTLATMEHMDPRRREFYEKYGPYPDDDPKEFWMGDHSHSWLTGGEMLVYAEGLKNKTQRDYGVVSLAEFDKWDGKSRPDSYCGGVGGQGIVTVTPETVAEWRASKHFPHAPDKVYVRIEWEMPALDDVAYFFEEVARLVGEHGEVRFVFGFDS
jgi:hypothetical protein